MFFVHLGEVMHKDIVTFHFSLQQIVKSLKEMREYQFLQKNTVFQVMESLVKKQSPVEKRERNL